MKPFRKSQRALSLRSSRAFTLVEVALALGVASFTLISMMGLLSVGLQTFHQAENTTTEAQIAQQLANQIQLSSYTQVQTNSANPFYFTREGLPTNAAGAVFTAMVSAPSKLYVPGASVPTASNLYPTNTLTFVIAISSVSSPRYTNSIPIQIGNNGS